MSGKLIPNVAPVGNDLVVTPLLIRVPLIMFVNDRDFLWCEHAMDASAADRMVAMSMAGASPVMYRVDVPLILPAAEDLEAAVSAPDLLVCDPLRVQMRAAE